MYTQQRNTTQEWKGINHRYIQQHKWVSEQKPDQKVHAVWFPRYKTRKCKLSYGDRKQVSGCLQKWGTESELWRDTRMFLEMMHLHYVDCGGCFIGVCVYIYFIYIYISRLSKLYSLNMCSLCQLYLNNAVKIHLTWSNV